MNPNDALLALFADLRSTIQGLNDQIAQLRRENASLTMQLEQAGQKPVPPVQIPSDEAGT